MKVGVTHLAASAAVLESAGQLCGCVLRGGSATADVAIYDNASAASGTVLLRLSAAATTTSVFPPGFEIDATNGLYANISGTGATVDVFFKP